VHPHDAQEFDAACEEYMLKHLDLPRVIAVGEIGLDYYYDNSPRDIQQKAFRRQLEIAVEKNLPVEIHTRDAEPDTVAILKEFGGRVQGLIHCFTGTQWLADEALAEW
jgi:TatD DNase family protein